MSSYEAAIKLIPDMAKNYETTFQDNRNRSDFYLNQINNFIMKLDSVDRSYKNMKFENVNPRKSQIIGINSLSPSFVSVKLLKLKYFLIMKLKFIIYLFLE